MRQRDKGQHVHPGEMLHFLWRYAFLLLIPFIRQLAAAQGTAWERLSATLTNLLLTLLVVAAAVIRWYTIRFRVRGGLIWYEKGVFWKKRLHIPFRAVDHLTQRSSPAAFLCGAVWVGIETSSGSRRRADAEILLSRRRAGRLFAVLEKKRHREQLYRPNFWQVGIMAASWSNGLSGLLVAAPFVQKAGQILGEQASRLLYDTVDFRLYLVSLGLPPVAAGIAWLLFFGWFFALLSQLFRYWRFAGWKQGFFLASRSGFFRTRRQMVRISHIYAVTARQTLFMAWSGLYTAYAHVAGEKKKNANRAVIAAAMGSRALFCRIRNAVAFRFPKSKKIRPPRQAATGYLLPVMAPVATVSLLAIVLNLIGAPATISFMMLPALLLLTWRIFVRIRSLRCAFFQPGEKFVLLRYDRGFSILTTLIPKEKIQTVRISQNPFQKRTGLCHVQISVYGEKALTCTVRQLNYQDVKEACSHYGLLPSQEGKPD